MCTVILRVPSVPGRPVRMLAVRDEDPSRPWQPLGPWWPDEHPGVVGVRDVRAGGAWLAASERRLAVLVNRASPPVPDHLAPVSRGLIVLDAASGRPPRPTPAVPGFNLVDITADGVLLISWDGKLERRVGVPPGTHMIAHDDLDDARTPRIGAWLDDFAVASTKEVGTASEPAWADEWLGIIARSALLGPVDERAIIRDNRPLGYPTRSLLLCAASVGPRGVDVRYAQLERPGRWNAPVFSPPRA
ncbi:MAG: NRDE family protein [Propionibacterium sp.]|nr:NRDE family protein [Propionibacterium sp.]